MNPVISFTTTCSTTAIRTTGEARSPVIFRATEQWFIGVDRPFADGGSLRERGLDSVRDGIDFVPAWGRNRMLGMLESRPDWCLSRQRAWGLPIPAFRTADGGTFLTAASVRAVATAFRARGSDAWFMETPETLLADYDPASDPDAPEGLDRVAGEDVRHLRRLVRIRIQLECRHA